MIMIQDQDNGALHETRDSVMRWDQGELKEGLNCFWHLKTL